MTRPNISTNSLTRSGRPSLDGRYIIERESPQAANEKPEPACWAAAFCALPSKSGGNTGRLEMPESRALLFNAPFRSADLTPEVESLSRAAKRDFAYRYM